MVLNYCGFHLIQFLTVVFLKNKDLKEVFVFSLGKQNKKSFNINGATRAAKVILSWKTNNI